MRTLFITLLLTLAAVTAHAEDVYRTVQSDGTVVYSDRPLSSDSVKITLNTRLSEEARVAAEASAAAAAAAAQAGSGDDDMAAALAEQQRLRAEACQKAREALALYERSPRLYETLPDGGRRYLSDEEIATARLEARRAVADFCEPETGN